MSHFAAGLRQAVVKTKNHLWKECMLTRLFTLMFVLALASAAVAEAPVLTEETDRYRMYSDNSIELKPEFDEFQQLTSEDFDRIPAARQEENSIDGAFQTAGAEQSTLQRGALVENAVPGLWKGFGGVPYGCNGKIEVIEKGSDGKIYFGGLFSACNDVVVNNC